MRMRLLVGALLPVATTVGAHGLQAGQTAPPVTVTRSAQHVLD